MAQNNAATDATLTEYHRPTTNPEADEHAAITMVQNQRGQWQGDEYETLGDGDELSEYHTECSCGETFCSWGAAIKHVEEDH